MRIHELVDMGLEVATSESGGAGLAAMLGAIVVGAAAAGLAKGLGGQIDLIDTHVLWMEDGDGYLVTVIQDSVPGSGGHGGRVEQRFVQGDDFEAALALATSATGMGPRGSNADTLYQHAERAMGDIRWIP
jgi:hypothetical protein